MINLRSARKTVEDFQALLDNTPQDKAHIRLKPDAWTLAEIVGHLIDSAGNNHQRFARLQNGDLEDFPAYEAESWVKAQRYEAMDFATLATLWTTYNAFLLHIAFTTPPHAMKNVWRTDDRELSLEFLITDYYDHMQLHVDHYRERQEEVALD